MVIEVMEILVGNGWGSVEEIEGRIVAGL